MDALFSLLSGALCVGRISATVGDRR